MNHTMATEMYSAYAIHGLTHARPMPTAYRTIDTLPPAVRLRCGPRLSERSSLGTSFHPARKSDFAILTAYYAVNFAKSVCQYRGQVL
jgi:hypothetical protein